MRKRRKRNKKTPVRLRKAPAFVKWARRSLIQNMRGTRRDISIGVNTDFKVGTNYMGFYYKMLSVLELLPNRMKKFLQIREFAFVILKLFIFKETET